MCKPTNWPVEAIWEAVAVDLPDFTVEVLPQIDSTNSELMRRARAGNLEPVLLIAQRQTAGRGRHGREWFSGTGTETSNSLTFSLGLPLSTRDWSGLSLAVGVSIVESLHPELRLKWPNDIWWQERKLAGILIETTSLHETLYAVIGIGINLQKPATSKLATPPAWLTELMPGIDGPQTLSRIVPTLVRALKIFDDSGFSPFQNSFQLRDATYGRSVTLSDGTVGTALGVDMAGALQVQTAQGRKRITSDDVSLRPLALISGENLLSPIHNIN